MPGVSTHSKIVSIVAALCSIPDFKYSEEEMWDLTSSLKFKPTRSTNQTYFCVFNVFERKSVMDDTMTLLLNGPLLRRVRKISKISDYGEER